jgi:hypothetical protein
MAIDINTVILLVVAVLTIVNTIISRHTEKNTNSMKDALVKSTADFSEAKGRSDMRQEMEDKRS